MHKLKLIAGSVTVVAMIATGTVLANTQTNPSPQTAADLTLGAPDDDAQALAPARTTGGDVSKSADSDIQNPSVAQADAPDDAPAPTPSQTPSTSPAPEATPEPSATPVPVPPHLVKLAMRFVDVSPADKPNAVADEWCDATYSDGSSRTDWNSRLTNSGPFPQPIASYNDTNRPKFYSECQAP